LSLSPFVPSSLSRPAFTLTEILIILGIVVLMLAMAIPAFNFITGGRSVEGATNQVSAFLARARSDAIGLQEVRGVMFYLDPVTERPMLAEVKLAGNNLDGNDAGIDYYLDISPDADFLPLPKGVNAQLLDNCAYNAAGARLDDGYIGYNVQNSKNASTTNVRYGGVILFDGGGRLISSSYAFRIKTTVGVQDKYTRMGELLLSQPYNTNANAADKDVVPVNASAGAVRSQFGLVLFEDQRFRNAGGTNDDAQITGAPYANEMAEEQWLDENGTPLVINRYNGTLVRAE
jgi:type II secretory pathway pseudopilin PulG